MPGEGHGERSRRHDIHELTHAHAHGHAMPHPHIQIPAQNLPVSPPAHSPASTRGSDRSTGRIHNHQRVGPGANINRDASQREWEQERNWEREREHEHEAGGRVRREAHEDGGHSGTWRREENVQGEQGMSHSTSRSVTPTSAPGNGGNRVPSRPSSGQETAYDTDRARSKSARVANLLGNDREPGYDDRDDRLSGPAARGSAAEMPVASYDSRRRYRGDVDVVDDYSGGNRSPKEGAHSQGSLSRGTKRRHSDDGEEDPNSPGDERMEEDD